MELKVGWAARLPREAYSTSSQATTAAKRTTQARNGWGRFPGSTPVSGRGRGCGRRGQRATTNTATMTIGSAVRTLAGWVKAVVVAAPRA